MSSSAGGPGAAAAAAAATGVNPLLTGLPSTMRLGAAKGGAAGLQRRLSGGTDAVPPPHRLTSIAEAAPEPKPLPLHVQVAAREVMTGACARRAVLCCAVLDCLSVGTALQDMRSHPPGCPTRRPACQQPPRHHRHCVPAAAAQGGLPDCRATRVCRAPSVAAQALLPACGNAAAQRARKRHAAPGAAGGVGWLWWPR
jgi:hypothetical protein